MAVTLYRQVGKVKARRDQKINLGRGRRRVDLTASFLDSTMRLMRRRTRHRVGDGSQRPTRTAP
jgi:hypothetical protein